MGERWVHSSVVEQEPFKPLVEGSRPSAPTEATVMELVDMLGLGPGGSFPV